MTIEFFTIPNLTENLSDLITIDYAKQIQKKVVSSGNWTSNSEIWCLTNVAIQTCVEWEIFQMNYSHSIDSIDRSSVRFAYREKSAWVKMMEMTKYDNINDNDG